MILRLGVDAVDGGWQYRGQDLKPGAGFTLTTADYIVKGTVLRVSIGRQAVTERDRQFADAARVIDESRRDAAGVGKRRRD